MEYTYRTADGDEWDGADDFAFDHAGAEASRFDAWVQYGSSVDEVQHRRRRIRSGKGSGAEPAATDAPPPAPATPREPVARPSAPGTRGHRAGHDADVHPAHTHLGDDGERGLRGLIGGGSTQVSVTAAMRARDAARPSAEDLARSAETLTIVHRGWQPRDPA